MARDNELNISIASPGLATADEASTKSFPELSHRTEDADIPQELSLPPILRMPPGNSSSHSRANALGAISHRRCCSVPHNALYGELTQDMDRQRYLPSLWLSIPQIRVPECRAARKTGSYRLLCSYCRPETRPR